MALGNGTGRHNRNGSTGLMDGRDRRVVADTFNVGLTIGVWEVARIVSCTVRVGSYMGAEIGAVETSGGM